MDGPGCLSVDLCLWAVGEEGPFRRSQEMAMGTVGCFGFVTVGYLCAWMGTLRNAFWKKERSVLLFEVSLSVSWEALGRG